MRSLFFNVLFGAFAVQGVLLATGCSGDGAFETEGENAETGTFSMPLVAEAGEHRYRVEGELLLNGPWYTWLSLGGEQEQVSVSLSAGDYYAYLYWYSLMRDDGSGNFVPVEATLVSADSVDFKIYNQTTTTVWFQFETDGQIVTVGTGQLNVDIDVHETTPLCTPLGTDCEAGTWCAPPELTGRTLSCIDEGPVAEGETCGSPLDCTANTSCFDFGAGPVCTRLCLGSEFGEPCGTDATCTAQGVDYGVCAPNP